MATFGFFGRKNIQVVISEEQAHLIDLAKLGISPSSFRVVEYKHLRALPALTALLLFDFL
jgi:hypothetical protein